MDGIDRAAGRLAAGAIGRGCVATALLASDGSLLHSEPEGILFPAAALTEIQRRLRRAPGRSWRAPLGQAYIADVTALEDGRLLVNLLTRPPGGEEPAAAPLRPGPAAAVRLEPNVIADWEHVAHPQLPAPLVAEPVEARKAEAEAEPEPPELKVEPHEPELDLQSRAPVRAWAAAARPARSARSRVTLRGLRLLGLLLLLVAVWVVNRRLGQVPAWPAPATSPPPAFGLLQPPAPAPAPILLTYHGDLGRGSFGDPVVLLQARLSQLGYFTYPDDTGYFGDATFGAVYSFQQARGLVNSGVADAATIIALNACDGRCADLPLPGAAVTGR